MANEKIIKQKEEEVKALAKRSKTSTFNRLQRN